MTTTPTATDCPCDQLATTRVQVPWHGGPLAVYDYCDECASTVLVCFAGAERA